jgi:lipid A 3-O-deacylase
LPEKRELRLQDGTFMVLRGFWNVATGQWYLAVVVRLGLLVIGVAVPSAGRAEEVSGLTNEVGLSQASVSSNGIWTAGVGEGFRSSAQSISVGAGVNYGVAAFGGEEAHHLALVNLTYGHMVSGVLGEGHWYRGNFEVRLELFTGAQFSPSTEWLVGLTPHVRYDFATGTRWVPFADIGAGVTGTGIGPPDLSEGIEFNLQAGGGVLWFFKDNVALTLDAHFMHWSCAGLHQPNLGLNGVTGMLGVSFFF